MRHTKLFLLIHCGFLAVATLAAQTNQPVIFPDEDALTPENLKLVWPATPGLRYEVRQSTNLQSWSTAPGYPATASGPAQQMPFLTEGTARFFQVRELDEQPPAIVSQYPQDGGFAVPRFANLTLQLADPTGINTNSIKLTVGSLGTFTLASPQLTFSNNLLTFINGGSIPLGGWGSNVQATLIVADSAGYGATKTWNFTLELQPQVVTNLFVFGSPLAQRTGQRIGNIPTAALAARFGPVAMGDGDPWTLELVASNRLEISYTNIAPVFATNTYVCNLTPRTTDEVFYRKITSVSNAPANKLLTLFTTNVPLAEILVEGSVSLSRNSVIYQVSNNVIVKAFDYDGVIPLGPIGVNTSQTLYDQGGVTLTLNEAKFLFTPSLRLSFETRGLSLNRFEAELQGRLETALVPELTIAGSLSDTKEFELSSRKWLVFVQAVPPVWLEIDFSIGAEVGYNLTVNARMSTGVRQNMDLGFGVDYVKDRSPSLVPIHSLNPHPTEIVPFTYEINGSGSAYTTIIPQIDLRVISLAGVYANVDPRVEISGSATVSNGQLTSANFGIVADADLNFGLSVFGLENGDLPSLPPFRLFRREWASVYPPSAQITIRHQPQSQTVVAGDYASFTVDALYSQPLSYQWFYGDVPIPGKTSPTLVLLNVNSSHAGPYHVRVSAGSLTTDSSEAKLTVVAEGVPAGMALIPAGSFQMGDNLDGDTDALPLHTVYVSAFYLERYEVTKSLWDVVYQWATNHGYGFSNAGSGKAGDHPVYGIGWNDALKWCNARSELEGKTPAYYTSAARTNVYRTGVVYVQNDWVNWNAGYRLPTEAEWEKAARGGLDGQRFPWGNIITHNEANYVSSASYGYDISTTRGYHPAYFDVCHYPGTSPVGSFSPGRYGLYDMAGNVWEMCWDQIGYYSSAYQTDPRGPTGWIYHITRGGDWRGNAAQARLTTRQTKVGFGSGSYDLNCGISNPQYLEPIYIGFRTVLPPGQ